MTPYTQQELAIIRETERRLMLKEAIRYEKEAVQKRASAARLLKEAEELEHEAAQNRSVAAGIEELK